MASAFIQRLSTVPNTDRKSVVWMSWRPEVRVVSDGGAARGYRRLERIRATTGFLLKLRRATNLIAWLNPMPRDRWEGSSADIMANIIPMFQMDDDGLSNAIDVVRGQPLQQLQAFGL